MNVNIPLTMPIAMLKIPQVNLKALSFEAFVLFHFGVITYYSEV